MTNKYTSDLLADVHKMASRLFKSGRMTEDEMKQFDRGCLSMDITGYNCVFDVVESLDEDDIEFLAKRIKANVAFTSILLDRKINFESIPHAFLQVFAEVFGLPLEQIVEFLDSADKVQQGKNHCSKIASNLNQMLSYEDAVQTTDLSKSQQRKLLSYLPKKSHDFAVKDSDRYVPESRQSF